MIYAEPEGTANALRVVQLPVFSTNLISLLSYIFPVRPILQSTTEHIMELLSVAQMYKMDVILTHIRNHIAQQQQPPFIRKETALFIPTGGLPSGGCFLCNAGFLCTCLVTCGCIYVS